MSDISKIIKSILINKSSINHKETKIQIMIIQTKSTANPKERPNRLIITNRIIKGKIWRSKAYPMLMKVIKQLKTPRRAFRASWPLSPSQPPQTLK